MTPLERQKYLKIGAIAVVGLWLVNKMVLEPVQNHWTAQSERIEALRDKVKRGHALLERQDALRQRWGEMQSGDLPADNSKAEDEVLKAINRWARDSRIGVTGFNPQWRTFDGYETYEVRASAVGDQASLGRLIYEIESDSLPVRLEDCEFSTRDKTGKQLTLSLRFSFVRLAETGGNGR